MPMSCTVTETLNGEWELTLVHDIDERGKWTQLSEGCILRAPVPAAMTPSVDLVTQQYQTSTYDVQIYKITTRSGPLHLRSGTGTNYKILGKYKKGREVIVLNKTTSSWYEVTAPDGKHGYMASQYLTFQRTETQAVQTNVGFRNQVIEARQLRDQPFRIYRVVPELDKVTVYARNIFYDLLDNMIKSLKPSPSAVGASVVQSLSEACLSSHDFSFYSDLTSTAEDVEWENVNPVEAMLGENGLVSKYGAELARDWYDVFLVRRVGNNTDVSIREKKNLTGISYDVDETDVVTRIMPTGEDTDGNILYLPELYLDSPNINAYTHPKWIHLPVSEAKEVTDGDEPKSKAQCYAEMRKAAQAEFDAGCDLPTVTLKVDFVNCSDAEEYKQYAALTDIFLGDSVRVIARRIGVEVSMRMTQYTYDCLTRKYISVTLGTAADTLEGSMISSRQLPSGVISGSKLAINSVGAGQLQSGSVGSLQVKMAAIQTAHILAINSVGAGQLQSGSVGSLQVKMAAIQTAHIQDAAITKASYYVQDHHAAIIDRAQYNRVRKIRAMCNSKLGPLQYPYDDKLVCPICGQRLIQRRSDVLDNKSAWHCERNERSCERYVLNSVIVNEAVLNACKALNRDEIQVVIEKLQGEKPQRSKSREKLTAAEHLLELWKKRLFLKKVDYYWLDDTVDRITFSKENTLTVHWRCGLKTTVPLPVRHHRENPVYAAEVYRKRKVEGTLKPRRRIQKRLEDPNPIPIIPVKEGQKK